MVWKNIHPEGESQKLLLITCLAIRAFSSLCPILKMFINWGPMLMETRNCSKYFEETVMGKDLFDHAFKTYSQRWMFKHPTPADFFRTMEDASAVDLDWFWRGWFYTTDYVDIGVKSVNQFFVSDEPSKEVIEMLKNYGMTQADLPPVVYTMVEDDEDFKSEYKSEAQLITRWILNLIWIKILMN